MYCIRLCISRLTSCTARSGVLESSVCPRGLLLHEPLTSQLTVVGIHCSAPAQAFQKKSGPQKWLTNNRKIYPPQAPDEERRPAFVCHMKTNIKYSPWKMWYIACLIRGMSVDEALKQLSFVSRKGSAYVKETLLEAQEMAVRDHNVEYKSNLWVSESFCGKGPVVRGIRRHARKRIGKVEYFYCHYFVCLEEGPPPKHYYPPPQTGPEMLQNWLQEMRQRRITGSM